jgi:hypothetical protein
LESNLGKKKLDVDSEESPRSLKKKVHITSPVTQKLEKSSKIFKHRKATQFPNLSTDEIADIEAEVRKRYTD